MIQDSFSKVLENENLEKLKHIASQRPSPPQQKKTKKVVHIAYHKSSSKKKKRI